MLFFLLLFHHYHGLTWTGSDDLSLVLPDATKPTQFYIIRDYSDNSVHVDIFDENNTISAVTLDDTYTDDVTQAVLVNDKVYFLTDSNTLIAFYEDKLFTVAIGENVDNFDTDTNWKMMAFPHNITNASSNHRFLVFLNTTNESHQELYIGMVQYENDEFELTSLTMNCTFDLSNTGHDESTTTISITQVAVNLVIAGGTMNNGNVDLSMYKTRATDAIELTDVSDAEVAGLIDADNNTSFSLDTSASSSIGLTVSQGVTGGMFIYSTRAALYSLYDGDYPEEIIDQSTKEPLLPSSDIRSIISGYNGDFIIVTEDTIYFGREAYQTTELIELNLDELLGDNGFVLSANANVVLISLSHVIVRQDDTNYIVDLHAFYASHDTNNPCPVYDIIINSYKDNWLIPMDSVEQLDSSTEVHGFKKARAIVATPLPNVMKVNTTNSKWKERSNVDSRRINATLIVDEEAARNYQAKNKWSTGSRIIPQNTWFYGDSALSCSQRTYENIVLHYGQCPIGQTKRQLLTEKQNPRVCDGTSDGSWLARHDSYVLDENDENAIIPMAFMQMTHYESKLVSGSKSGQTGLMYTPICSEQWGKFQQFTEEEKRHESNDPNSNVRKTRKQKRGQVKVATKVGKPFIPNFELIFSEMDTNERPTLKSTKPITGGYTIVVQEGPLNEKMASKKDPEKRTKLNKDGYTYVYTFDAKMAKCASKPQNYYALLEAINVTIDPTIDYNNIWSRDNFADCDKVPDHITSHNYTSYENEPYPILGNHYTVPVDDFKDRQEDIMERIKKHLPYSYWDPDSQFSPWYSSSEAKQQLRTESCSENSEGQKVCENRIIFTRPGTYIATAILLDPIVTSCNLRFSFFVKVTELETIFDQELVMVGIITSSCLALLLVIYLVQPYVEHYFRKSVSSIARKSGLGKRTSKRRTARSLGNFNPANENQ